MLAFYDNNGDFGGNRNIRGIFDHWNISRNDLANTHLTTIAGGPVAFGEWYSMGRNPHGGDISTINAAGGPYYMRPLGVWGNGAKHKALVGTRSSDGWNFAVLVDCGNLALLNIPTPKAKPKPKPEPESKPKPKPTPKPVASFSCTALQVLKVTNGTGASKTGATVEFRGNGEASNTAIQSYIFDFGDGSSKTVSSSQTNVSTTHDYAKPGTYTIKLRVKTAAGTTPDEPDCQTTLTVGPLSPDKVVANTSRPKDDPAFVNANNTTVKAGETLKYTISQNNSTTSTVKDYEFQENLNDVLEYADLVDKDGGTLNGGILSWPKQDIKSNQTAKHTFSVKVKDPVPATPTARSDPNSYDLCMDNVFEGKETRVCVNIPPPPKIVEQTTQALPNTGVSAGALFSIGFISIATFFFLRNRQLIREISILRKQYHQGGNS